MRATSEGSLSLRTLLGITFERAVSTAHRWLLDDNNSGRVISRKNRHSENRSLIVCVPRAFSRESTVSFISSLYVLGMDSRLNRDQS